MDSHARTLTRILHDAASPGIRWGLWSRWECCWRAEEVHAGLHQAVSGSLPWIDCECSSHCCPRLCCCRGWEPSDAELEEATLAVQLLAELAPARHLLAAAPQLTEAAYRLSARWVGCWPCWMSGGWVHAARFTLPACVLG